MSKCNNEIKLSEKINKGIKKLENEEKNIIKDLSYVSKINKNKKQMKNILQELMNSLKFDYKEEQNKIDYKEFYFNGIPIPNNIEFIDNSNNLSWKIDNDNILIIN